MGLREIMGLPPKPVGAAEDMARTAGPALERGTLGTINMGNDLGARVRSGMAWLAGITPEQLDAINQVQSNFGIGVPAKTSDVIAKAEEAQGPLYQPQTTAGDITDRFVSNIPGALMGPGSLLNKGLSAGGAALGGYAGKEGTKKLVDALESYMPRYRDKIEKARPFVEGTADIAGNIIGSMAPNAVKNAVTPNPMTDNRLRDAQILDEHGVEMTAGQRTGNQALHYAESQTGGPAYSNMRDRQGRQYTAGALSDGGIVNADEASPAVLNRQHEALGQEFDRLQGYGMNPDPQFFDDLVQLRDDYRATMPQNSRAPIIETTVRQLADRARSGTPVDGEFLRKVGTQLRRQRQQFSASGRADDAQAVDSLIEAIDGNVERSLAATNPNEVGAYRDLRTRYRNLITLEEAASNAPDAQLSPADLTRATKKMENRRGYSRGFGPFNNYSRAGAEILTEPANSGTTSRLVAALGGGGKSLTAATVMGGLGAAVGGVPGAGVGAAIGAAGDGLFRFGKNYIRMTPAMQAYLANQVARGWTPEVGSGTRAATIGATNLRRFDERKR